MIYNLVRVIDRVIDLAVWLIIIRAFSSIIIRDYGNPIVRALYDITEPILKPFRIILERLGVDLGRVDLSPFLAIVALNFLSRIIWQLAF